MLRLLLRPPGPVGSLGGVCLSSIAYSTVRPSGAPRLLGGLCTFSSSGDASQPAACVRPTIHAHFESSCARADAVPLSGSPGSHSDTHGLGFCKSHAIPHSSAVRPDPPLTHPMCITAHRPAASSQKDPRSAPLGHLRDFLPKAAVAAVAAGGASPRDLRSDAPEPAASADMDMDTDMGMDMAAAPGSVCVFFSPLSMTKAPPLCTACTPSALSQRCLATCSSLLFVSENPCLRPISVPRIRG